MYDSPKVIAGIVIFLMIMTSPFWLNAGKPSAVPKPELPVSEKECVEKAEDMRTSHMQILDDWRHEVVREADREYVSPSGKTFNKSLTKGCLRCHEDKKKFCDRCHIYAGAKPYCFECHIDPKEKI